MRESSIPIDEKSSQTQAGQISEVKNDKRVHACSFEGCDKVFAKDITRRRHELGHKTEAMVPCNKTGCGKAFHRADHAHDHKKRCHSENQLEARSSDARQVNEDDSLAGRTGLDGGLLSELHTSLLSSFASTILDSLELSPPKKAKKNSKTNSIEAALEKFKTKREDQGKRPNDIPPIQQQSSPQQIYVAFMSHDEFPNDPPVPQDFIVLGAFEDLNNAHSFIRQKAWEEQYWSDESFAGWKYENDRQSNITLSVHRASEIIVLKVVRMTLGKKVKLGETMLVLAKTEMQPVELKLEGEMPRGWLGLWYDSD